MNLKQVIALSDKEPDEALRLACSRLNDYPNDVEALYVAWKVLMSAERFGLAYNVMKRALEVSPNDPGIWNNVGLALHGMMRLEDAEKCFLKSIQLDPKNIPALNNMALICVGQHRPEDAIKYADRSLSITNDPEEQASVMESRGYGCLMLGRWKEGWDGFEAMIGGKYRPIHSLQGEGYWKGEKVETLLVVGEQGIGDEISFASILPDLIADKDRVKTVIYECDARLEGLFKRSLDIPIYGTRFIQHVMWPHDYKIDAHVLSGSLGRYYRLTDESFSKKPYLIADPERRLQWRALLDSLGPKLKVGIAWTGGNKRTFGERRTLKLEEMLPILRQDATFISLQYKDPSSEIAEFEKKHGIKVHHWARCTEAKDYDETAALVAELDLVIAVPTAVVDLCGGLGKDCWVLVPQKPHWRFTKPVWTDARLYRQKKDWAYIINKLAEDLGERCSTSSSERTPANRLHLPPSALVSSGEVLNQYQ